MAGPISTGLLSVRPSLTRTRSNTSPASPNEAGGPSPVSSNAIPKSPPRPSHNRSKSYIPPADKKPLQVQNLPTIVSPDSVPEPSRFPRLHLPGKTHSIQKDDVKQQQHKRHRYTQSESQQHHRRKDAETTQESSIHTTHPSELLYPGSRGAAIPSLMRMRSYRSSRGQQIMNEGTMQSDAHASRTRSNSDPKSKSQPTESMHTKSPVEVQLEKAALLRYAARHNATTADIERFQVKLKGARQELSSRLDKDTHTAAGLVQRLDQTHEALHRTSESLIDTMSSFSNLAQQSAKLLTNFDVETSNLDSSLRQRIRRLRNDVCTKRTKRVTELEGRGKAISQRAEDLGRRLENCRIIVKNWEEREIKKRKTWKGVRNGIIWGLVLIIFSLFAGVLSWKAVQFTGEKGTPQKALEQLVQDHPWSEDKLAGAIIPEDVRQVLYDIASRGKEPRKFEMPIGNAEIINVAAGVKADKRLRLLDEL